MGHNWSLMCAVVLHFLPRAIDIHFPTEPAAYILVDNVCMVMVTPTLRMVERFLAVVFSGDLLPGGPEEDEDDGPEDEDDFVAHFGPAEDEELVKSLAISLLGHQNWRRRIGVDLYNAKIKFETRAAERPATSESIYVSLVRLFIIELVRIFNNSDPPYNQAARNTFSSAILVGFGSDFARPIMTAGGWIFT